MNRTYWALALGCNAIVLDSVYYALDHCLFECFAAYRFWKIVKTINALRQQKGRLFYKSIWTYAVEIPEKLNEHNYRDLYDKGGMVEWPTDTTCLSFRFDAQHPAECIIDVRRYAVPGIRVLLCGDGKNWLERLPAVLRELETP